MQQHYNLKNTIHVPSKKNTIYTFKIVQIPKSSFPYQDPKIPSKNMAFGTV